MDRLFKFDIMDFRWNLQGNSDIQAQRPIMKPTLIKAINVLLRVYYELIMWLIHCIKLPFKSYIYEFVLLEM